jgi:hypothetical protein
MVDWRLLTALNLFKSNTLIFNFKAHNSLIAYIRISPRCFIL